jgi:hypothetical protein
LGTVIVGVKKGEVRKKVKTDGERGKKEKSSGEKEVDIIESSMVPWRFTLRYGERGGSYKRLHEKTDRSQVRIGISISIFIF